MKSSWFVYILVATVAGGASVVLSKMGMKHSSAHVALFVRTGILFSSIITLGLLSGDLKKITEVDQESLLILIATGIVTAIYWFFYFKALQLGSASRVAAIDKASIVITVLLSVIFLKEQITYTLLLGVLLILVGCVLVVTDS